MKRIRLFLLVVLCSLGLAAVACSDNDDTDIQKDGGSSTTKKDSGGSMSTMGPFCLPTCKTVDDCCDNPPCDKGMLAYSCSKGYCKYIGCRTDADCVVAGVKTGTCAKSTASGYEMGTCGNWCTKDSECKAPSKCVINLTAYNKKGCGVPCTTDKECSSYSYMPKCVNNKYCGPESSLPDKCTKNDQCPGATGGLDKCNINTGKCYCSSDKVCQDAFKSYYKGNVKCAKWPF